MIINNDLMSINRENAQMFVAVADNLSKHVYHLCFYHLSASVIIGINVLYMFTNYRVLIHHSAQQMGLIS